jgi:hypothetical protein
METTLLRRLVRLGGVLVIVNLPTAPCPMTCRFNGQSLTVIVRSQINGRRRNPVMVGVSMNSTGSSGSVRRGLKRCLHPTRRVSGKGVIVTRKRFRAE